MEIIEGNNFISFERKKDALFLSHFKSGGLM